MGTGKERIRRWRERNEKEGKKSVTIVISKEAYNALNVEKNNTGDSYGAIVERSLLTQRKQKILKPQVTSNIVGNIPSNKIIPTVTVQTKSLIDEEDYSSREQHTQSRNGGFILAGEEPLSQGFLPRLFKSSRKKFFKR